MKQHYLGVVLSALLLVACGREGSSVDTEPVSSAPPASEAVPEPSLPPFAEVAQAFAGQAQQGSQQMLTLCTQMQMAIEQFLADVSAQTQAEARDRYQACYQAWVSASLYFQMPFELSEAKSFHQLIEIIDTRPFLPGYIDGIPEYPYSGLVHELDMPINQSTLRSQHRLMDEDSASVGFPVVEFFLWKTPIDSVWRATQVGDDHRIVDRRKQYLAVATELLMTQLTQANLRWQSATGFKALPERAQLALVVKSLQRSAAIELLANRFSAQVLVEPDWHHPALLSGQGRDYPLLRLAQMQKLLATAAVQAWFSQQPALPVSAEVLQAALSAAEQAVMQLPANYPFDTAEDSETWQAAQQQIAALAELFSQLSEHFQVPLATE